jgi:hypothetical protein
MAVNVAVNVSGMPEQVGDGIWRVPVVRPARASGEVSLRTSVERMVVSGMKENLKVMGWSLLLGEVVTSRSSRVWARRQVRKVRK